MVKYGVRFQNRRDLMVVEAGSSGEARREFNKHISIKLLEPPYSVLFGCVAQGEYCEIIIDVKPEYKELNDD